MTMKSWLDHLWSIVILEIPDQIFEKISQKFWASGFTKFRYFQKSKFFKIKKKWFCCLPKQKILPKGFVNYFRTFIVWPKKQGLFLSLSFILLSKIVWKFYPRKNLSDQDFYQIFIFIFLLRSKKYWFLSFLNR